MNQERLKSLLDYNPETGVFTRRVTRCHNAKAGQKTGCKNRSGYLVIHLDGKVHYAHRLAWLYVHGEAPPKGMDIDHINRDKSDNRIANLRLVSRSLNMLNVGLKANNTSGKTGVFYVKRMDHWVVRIRHNKRDIHVGTFRSKADAVAARIDAEQRYIADFSLGGY